MATDAPRPVEDSPTPGPHTSDAPRPVAPAGSEIVFVAIVPPNRVLGDGRDQPFRLREDFEHFKALTIGHPVLMGRGTFDAIGRPLPRRDNVVVTRDASWAHEGVHVARDLTAALALAAGLPGGEQIMVLGGGQIFAELMPLASRLEMTEIDLDVPGTVVFPPIDEDEWVEVSRDDRWAFAFVTYRRRTPRA